VQMGVERTAVLAALSAGAGAYVPQRRVGALAESLAVSDRGRVAAREHRRFVVQDVDVTHVVEECGVR